MDRSALVCQPLVSIIIPCWNAESSIGEAIESALRQTYPEVEVVVIDDGSTDNSLDVIKSFGDRIRWESGPNKGACAARNRGVSIAKGEFIQFLDSDDVLYQEKLTKMVPVALNGDRDTLAICDWEYQVERDAEPTPKKLRYQGMDAVTFSILGQIQTSSPLHRRINLIEIGGFDETLPCSQERDLHLRLACHGIKFIYVPEVLYQVRRRDGSVSSDMAKVLEQRLAIFLNAKHLLALSNELTDERRQALAYILSHDGRRSVRHGMISKAREYFSAARDVVGYGDVCAFQRWSSRALASSIGPVMTERLIQNLVRIGQACRTSMLPD